MAFLPISLDFSLSSERTAVHANRLDFTANGKQITEMIGTGKLKQNINIEIDLLALWDPLGVLKPNIISVTCDFGL